MLVYLQSFIHVYRCLEGLGIAVWSPYSNIAYLDKQYVVQWYLFRHVWTMSDVKSQIFSAMMILASCSNGFPSPGTSSTQQQNLCSGSLETFGVSNSWWEKRSSSLTWSSRPIIINSTSQNPTTWRRVVIYLWLPTFAVPIVAMPWVYVSFSSPLTGR